MFGSSFSRDFAMTDAIRPLIAGNWKMNGLKASDGRIRGHAGGRRQGRRQGRSPGLSAGDADRGLRRQGARRQRALAIGAQDCHPKASGAHTGDISAEMLADAGASAVIVGHSERRADHGESDALVRQKAEAAWRAGLTAIVCIGETRQPARCRANPRYLPRTAQGLAAGRGDGRAIWWWPMSRSGRSAPG